MAIPRQIISFDPFELRRFLNPEETEGESATIPMDVQENGDSYIVDMLVPGTKKEDIQVTIDGNQVTVNAEIKSKLPENDPNTRVLRKERFYGKLTRTFQLGSELDETKSTAKLNEGILQLVLYKKVGDAAKKLEVQ